jgi:hypothetical protein
MMVTLGDAESAGIFLLAAAFIGITMRAVLGAWSRGTHPVELLVVAVISISAGVAIPMLTSHPMWMQSVGVMGTAFAAGEGAMYAIRAPRTGSSIAIAGARLSGVIALMTIGALTASVLHA